MATFLHYSTVKVEIVFSDFRRAKMKYLMMVGLLGMALLAVPNAHAQRVVVGFGFGPAYVGPPPACVYGYYDFYPYTCAPYGYYGPDWFSGGVFIGTGPWFHGYYGRGYYSRPGYYGRGGFRGQPFVRRDFDDRGRGYEGRGRSGNFRGGDFQGRGFQGQAFRGGNSRGSGGFRGGNSSRGGGNSFHGGGGSRGGGSFHGGGGGSRGGGHR
jgi:hypothetical protein